MFNQFQVIHEHFIHNTLGRRIAEFSINIFQNVVHALRFNTSRKPKGKSRPISC